LRWGAKNQFMGKGENLNNKQGGGGGKENTGKMEWFHEKSQLRGKVKWGGLGGNSDLGGKRGGIDGTAWVKKFAKRTVYARGEKVRRGHSKRDGERLGGWEGKKGRLAHWGLPGNGCERLPGKFGEK